MKVGVLQTLGLGDFLTALPAIRALRRHYRDAELTWIGKPEYLQLVEPIFDQVVELRYLTDAVEIPRLDIGVNLHGSGPVSHQLLVRSRDLLAFHEPRFAPRGPAWRSRVHIRQHWIDLLSRYGISGDPNDFYLDSPEGSRRGASVLHIAPRDRDRWWPLERFAEVARAVSHPVVIGHERVKELPAYSLLELQEVVSAAELVIGVDSGIAHLAYAYGRPTITLFGPAPALRWGPPCHVRHVVLGNRTKFDRVQPEGPCSSHLMRVSSEEVVAACRTMMGESPRASA